MGRDEEGRVGRDQEGRGWGVVRSEEGGGVRRVWFLCQIWLYNERYHTPGAGR